MTGAIERIVVALDAVSESRAAIGAASRLAARWKLRLHGIFVEDDDLIRLARMPFARQVTLGSGVESLTVQQAERQLRAFAARARHDLVAAARRHGVEYSFEVVRGAAAETVAAAAGDFLVAGTATRPVGRHFRVVGRWWSVSEPGPASFLLAHRDWHAGGTIAVLVHNREPATERLLAAVARLAAADGRRLAVICVPALAETPGFRAWLDGRLAGHGVEAGLELVPGNRGSLFRRLTELGCRLVALEAGAPQAQPDRLREMVAKTGCDVLLVR